MKCKDWIGRTIVSQYGLICEVLNATEKDGEIWIECRARYKNKIWNWTTYHVNIVTKNNEMLDVDTGEIFGKINESGHWELYKDDRCRVLSEEELAEELNASEV